MIDENKRCIQQPPWNRYENKNQQAKNIKKNSNHSKNIHTKKNSKLYDKIYEFKMEWMKLHKHETA